MKVISTTYSAQYGHTSGGFIEYTSKSGHEHVPRQRLRVHGRRRVQQEHDLRRARRHREDADPQRQLRLHARRSVRLPGYNGRNKTHFFVNVDYTRIRSGTIAGLRQYDAHRCVQGRRFRRAADGHPDWYGRAGTADLPGADLRSADDADGEQHSRARSVPWQRIPAGHPLRSRVASRIVPMMVQPDRAGLANNVAGIGTGDQTWELDARNIMFRVDQNFTPEFQDEPSFYWNRRPSVRNCEGVDGCNYEFDPEKRVCPEHRLLRQRVLPAHLHAPCAPAVRLDHQQQPAGPLHGRVGPLVHGWQSPVGGRGLAGAAVARDRQSDRRYRRAGCRAARRCDSMVAAVPYTPIGLEGWPRFGFEKNDRWQFSSDITWAKGRHTIKGGFEFRHHNFPIPAAGQPAATAGNFNFDRLGTAGFDALGNNLTQTGDPFASFLLGQVQTSNQLIPVFHTFRETYTALFVNDEFKVSDKLTLTAGLRFDYESARTEADDQVLDLQPDDTEPRSGRNSGRDDLRGRGSGALGTAQVRGRPQRCLGSAPGLRLSNRRPAGRSRRLRDLLRERRVQSGRSANAGIRIGPVRAEQHQRHLPRTSPGRGLPRRQSPVSAVHRSDNQYRRERHRRRTRLV